MPLKSPERFNVRVTPPVEKDAEITLVFSLTEFRGLHNVVSGMGTMDGAWQPILDARRELDRNGITV